MFPNHIRAVGYPPPGEARTNPGNDPQPTLQLGPVTK